MPVDNSKYLKAAALQRHLDCVARVLTALDTAKRSNTPVTVSGIAKAAGVSRTFLHDPAQADLLTKIRNMAPSTPTPTAPVPPPQRMSTESHQAIVQTLKKANQALRAENDQLRQDLAQALGQLRDLRRGVPAH
ncbi:DUF6262 family protein [Streptomyces sioyaensis]|uniref:DUF6262 family protein n=1 Tax=Streptomyces sioyaensis TaxID=67364 RepID=UPI0033D97816